MTDVGSKWWWQKYATKSNPLGNIPVVPSLEPGSPALCYPGKNWGLSHIEIMAADQMFNNQCPWPWDLVVAVPDEGPHLWEPGKHIVTLKYKQERLVRDLCSLTLPSGGTVCYWVLKNPSTYGWLADSRLFETASIAMEFANTGNKNLIHADWHQSPGSGNWTVQHPPLTFDMLPGDTLKITMPAGYEENILQHQNYLAKINQIPVSLYNAIYGNGGEIMGPSAETTVLTGLTEAIPALNKAKVKCPALGDPLPDTSCECDFCLEQAESENEKCSRGEDTLRRVIVHLNDNHKWTREQIADWLDSLDLDLRFPDPADLDAA